MRIKRSLISFLIAVVLVFGTYSALCIVTKTPQPLHVVASGSMIPTLYPYDVIIIEGIEPSEVKVGDIIVYKHKDKLIIHRVIERMEVDQRIYFKTKGDHNLSPDPWVVRGEDIVGRWTGIRVPIIGQFILFLKSEVGMALIVLLVILLAIYDYYQLKRKTARYLNT